MWAAGAQGAQEHDPTCPALQEPLPSCSVLPSPPSHGPQRVPPPCSAIQLLGGKLGDKGVVHPNDHVNKVSAG